MSKTLGIALVIIGVTLNNIVYLQDLWFGQGAITLDGPRAIIGIVVSIAIVVAGLVVMARKTG